MTSEGASRLDDHKSNGCRLSADAGTAMGGRMPATISKLDPLSQPEYWAGRAMANRMSDTTPDIYANNLDTTRIR